MRRYFAIIVAVLCCLSTRADDFNGWEIRKSGQDTWIKAVVPGTVAFSYLKAGLLEDIRYDDNLTRIDDGWYDSDFEYRTSFRKPAGLSSSERVILNFDGISWKADITLNGKNVGNIEGSFLRSHFDITPLLSEENELKVLIHRQDNPGKVKIPTLEKHVRNGGILGADNPCFHASIGWDWLPTLPGRSIGIWNDVYLTRIPEGIVVEDAFFDTELDRKYYPGTDVRSPEYATVYPTVTVCNRTGDETEGDIAVRFGEKKIVQHIRIPAGRSDIVLDSFRIDRPELWWPVGYGEPHLYDVSVSLSGSEKHLRCGIRQMFYTLEDSALQMYINGRRFIPKGGNWGFSDINLRYGSREYAIALRMHREMNLNMIRNWVGQIGDEEFYDACDEAGVMVWQDFWLANPHDGPDPDDTEMFVRNAEDMIRRVRPHACVALFCARNEGTPKRPLELKLNRLVSELCPRSLYIACSSEFLVSGQGPYQALPPVDYFRNRSMKFDIPVGDNKFHSERGAPCIPSLESMERMFRPEHRWPQNDVWAMHCYTLGGAQKCSTVNDMVSRGFGGEPKSMQEFSDRAQYVNYNTYRAMFESRSERRNGILLWMTHPAWPCLVFQTYDYYFDVNASVFATKRGAAPLRIQWNPVLGCIEVVNDCFGDVNGAEAEVRILDVYGHELLSSKSRIDSRNDSTQKVCDICAPDGQEIYYIKLELKKDGRTIADNFYWEGAQTGVWTAIPQASGDDLRTEFTVGKECVFAKITNIGDRVLPMVRIDLKSRKGRKAKIEQVLPSFYEDNYFALLPGESRSIRIGYIAEEHRDEIMSVTARALR